jgi:hypothetical protein
MAVYSSRQFKNYDTVTHPEILGYRLMTGVDQAAPDVFFLSPKIPPNFLAASVFCTGYE